jgi:Tfp pilus assembly protein PilN
MQQVNLFQAEYSPTPQRLGLRVLLQAAIGTLLVLLVIGVFLLQQLSRERSRSEEARAGLDSVITAISQSKGNEHARQRVAEQMQQLRTRLEEQQALLADLQQREQRQTHGFASLLHALAAQHDSRLWLTHIALKDERLLLAGETLNAAAVPAWLGQLQHQPPIQGLRFGGLQLLRIESKPGVLAFAVTPEPEPDNEGDANDATAQR